MKYLLLENTILLFWISYLCFKELYKQKQRESISKWQQTRSRSCNKWRNANARERRRMDMLNKSLILDFVFNFSWKHPKFAKPVKWKFWDSTAFSTNHKTAMKLLLVIYFIFVIRWNSCRRLKFLSYWLSTRLLYKSTLVQSLDVFDFSFNRPWPVWQYGLSSFQAGVQN